MHCTIAGYPSDGPDAERPGYDFLMQGLGGIMSITGEPDGEPMKVAVAISDIVAGLFAELGGAGGAGRARRAAARGRSCEVSLLDAQVAWLANRAGDWLISGIEPQRLGNAHPSIVPYETFRAADGYVNLAVGTDDHFRRFCREAGRDDLADDPRWQTNAGRVEGRDVLVPQLRALIAGRTVAEWSELLERAHVPGGPVLTIPETFAGPAAHMVERVRASQRRARSGWCAHRCATRPSGRAAGCRRRGWASTAPRCWPSWATATSEIAEPARGRLQASLESRLPARMWRNW